RPRTLAPPAGIAPLAGYTVAVASDRRRHALAGLLEAAGARTVGIQAVRAYSAADDPSVRAATRDALAGPIDELVVAADFGLRGRGAEVVEVCTYQCAPPVHADLLRRFGDQIVNRQVDAVVFTGAPAVEHVLAQAAVDHRRDDVLNALADEVPAVCLGELTAAP